jgi:hypothetical protein
MTDAEQPEVPATDQTMISRRQTTTMSDFFKNNDLNQSTKELLMKYDKDGNGYFSKEEVTAIIGDLQEQFHENEQLLLSNKLLKQLLCGAVVFFFLLVASIFGLTFAVVSLTKETSVNFNTGTMYTSDGSTVISTNSHADLHQAVSIEGGAACLTMASIEAIKTQVLEGRNVVVQSWNGNTFELDQLSPSGAIYDEDTGVTCIPKTGGIHNGTFFCFSSETSPACNTEAGRRFLADCSSDPLAAGCTTGTGLTCNCRRNNRDSWTCSGQSRQQCEAYFNANYPSTPAPTTPPPTTQTPQSPAPTEQPQPTVVPAIPPPAPTPAI